jgi:transcriptional regulator with XRE-family HTH domain
MTGPRASSFDPIQVPDHVWDAHQAELHARDVGTLFRLAKRYAGASQNRIAAATGVPQSRVNALMNNRGGPVTSIDVLHRIADGLNLPDDARIRLGLAPKTTGGWRPLIDRTPPSCVMGPPETGRGFKAWPHATAELDRALQRREVSLEAVHALEDLVVLLRRLDDEIGPGQLIGTVTMHLASVSTLLAQAEPAGNAFRGLSGAAASLSQLAGWLSFDLNDTNGAHRHLATAHRAATASGDQLLAAYALSWQSVIVGQDDPDAGLALASAAHRRVGADAPASVHAWLGRVEAEVSAGRGDRSSAEEALDRVAQAAAAPRTERDPAWTYFIDDSQIAAYRGVCYVRLGLGRQAEAALHAALDGLPASFVRDRCLYLTYLGAAHLLQRQPEAAARAAIHALPLALRTESLRSLKRLADIDRALTEWPELPEVQELHDLLVTYRYG